MTNRLGRVFSSTFMSHSCTNPMSEKVEALAKSLPMIGLWDLFLLEIP